MTLWFDRPAEDFHEAVPLLAAISWPIWVTGSWWLARATQAPLRTVLQ